MNNSTLYHTLPTIRKMRRKLRRMAKKYVRIGTRQTIVPCIYLRDDEGRDVLKTRRWRNRFMTTSKELVKWG